MRVCLSIGCLLVFAGNSVGYGSDLLDILRSASLALGDLHSAQGTGTFQVERDGHLVEEMGFDVVFDGDKYFLDITHKLAEPPKLFYERHTLVCDGEAIFSTRFSPRIKPGGCDTQVYRKSIGTVFVASGGFRWDPNRLAKIPMDVIKVDDRYEIVVHEEEGGILRASYNLSPVVAVEFLADPKVGYNVTSVTCFDVSQGREVVSAYNVTWDRQNSVWFIKKLVREEPRERRKLILTYAEFTANSIIAKDHFTMAKLAPCAGSRIVDRRRSGRALIHNLEKTTVQRESELDGIAAELAAMPMRFPDADATQNSTLSKRTIAWIGINLLLFTGVIVWSLVRRKRASDVQV